MSRSALEVVESGESTFMLKLQSSRVDGEMAKRFCIAHSHKLKICLRVLYNLYT